jgi:hypothetical protein
MKTYEKYLFEKKWSGKVDTKWQPPEGTFTKDAGHIADVLAKASSDLKQAMSRLNFYVNRGGKNFTNKDLAKFEKVKDLLRKKMGGKE